MNNFDPSGDQRETKKHMSTILPRKARRDIEGEGLKDVAQLAYAIGKATVGTKKSKQKARSDFVKGAKSSFK